jgi:hypothetical protein
MKLPSLLKSLMPDRLTPAAVALLYVAFAALWIVVSGHLLTITVADPVLMGRIELAKGLAFVSVTGGLLYLLLRVRGATSIHGPVVAILSATPGTVQGKDYRGVKVLAAYRPVAGTNWHIVVKIVRAEVLAPLRDLVLWSA